MRELDSTDRILLNLLQEGIPLTEEPYRDLGERLGGLSAQEVITRITRLRKDGWIRRFSGFFHASALGYHALLCAMRVPEEHVEDMAALIRTIPGITHNYLRDHTLNMWFTLSCRRQEDLDRVIERLESSGWTDRVCRFERLRQFKIHAAFDVREEEP